MNILWILVMGERNFPMTNIYMYSICETAGDTVLYAATKKGENEYQLFTNLLQAVWRLIAI